MKRPIEPQDYTHGPTVVEIGDIRVARGQTRVRQQVCKHLNIVFDQSERRLWCEDCENDVDPFDAIVGLHSGLYYAHERLKKREEKVREAEEFTLRSRAAKKMDDHWRQRSMVPLCPHCSSALLPEDVVGGLSSASADLVRAKRRRDKA